MSKKLLFIFNPHSGKEQIRNQLVDIVDIMVKAGYEVTIHPTQAQRDAVEVTESEYEKYELVVCSGGDGTLDEVVTALNKCDATVPVGYIPAGSTNDFAISLGLPKNMTDAADRAVNGEPFPCDVGYFNGGTFVYVAAFGIFTEVSYATPQSMKNLLGHAAYILQGAKSITNIPSYQMHIEHDGEAIDGEFIYGMVTNSVSVGGFKGLTGDNVKLDDGVFEVTMIHTPHNPLELNEIILFLTGLSEDTRMVESFKSAAVTFTTEEEVAWTMDGEFGGKYRQVDIRNLNKKIKIMR